MYSLCSIRPLPIEISWRSKNAGSIKLEFERFGSEWCGCGQSSAKSQALSSAHVSNDGERLRNEPMSDIGT
ncbi:hypothetical protein H9L39_06929 [Fusarium oxysporum f. sp. albedinis]|nr:hypothetical protein H9L39_06929 [Fusarium oxysporum f. sp. albedinis]